VVIDFAQPGIDPIQMGVYLIQPGIHRIEACQDWVDQILSPRWYKIHWYNDYF